MWISSLVKLYRLLFLHLKLRISGVDYGKKLRGNRVIIKSKGRISLGHRVLLNSYPGGELYKTGLLTHCPDAVITIGDNCNLNGMVIHCRSSVVVGANCLFGPGSKIIDNDSHRITIDAVIRRREPVSRPVILGDNVWVGMNSLILKGVKIGDNAIVAANSTVTRDIPANVLVGGNPATLIREITD